MHDNIKLSQLAVSWRYVELEFGLGGVSLKEFYVDYALAIPTHTCDLCLRGLISFAARIVELCSL